MADTVALPLEPVSEPEPQEFRTGDVLTIAGGHFMHDVFSSFLSPLLPLLIERLSLSLTLAGSLSSIMQFPALLNPYIGYLADKANLRYFVILAPGVTATLMSLLGIMPSYAALAILLFTVGISVAAFHAPAPAMIGRVSGEQVGRGMSYFMAGGELARTVGPLLVVWAVSMWGLEGIWRLMFLGWGASSLLYLQLRRVPAQPTRKTGFRDMLPAARRVFPPLVAIVIFRSLLNTALSIFLPTYMAQGGASLWVAGASLAILEFAGVGGALLAGPISDRFGRKPVLIAAFLSGSALAGVFLNVSGWLLVPVLLGLGLTILSTQPVLLAVVQDQLPEYRAIANGLYMALSFIVRTLAILLVGVIGDSLGLRSAYLIGAVSMLLTVPAVLWLPARPEQTTTA